MPRTKEPFHLLADRTRRRLHELQEVVTKELAAPYTVKYLPDTGQIVLTPERRVVATVQPEPTQEERLIMAVWRIRSLHLSRTESRYLVGSITYGVVCTLFQHPFQRPSGTAPPKRQFCLNL